MRRIFIINGRQTSGKDTFINFVEEHMKTRGLPQKIYNISTVDFVKRIATDCGWNGEKTESNRKFLSDLKDLLSNWKDVPFEKVAERIEKTPEGSIIFIHCREPQEINKFVERLAAETICIIRSGTPELESNHADRDVFNYTYDWYVYNDKDLVEFSYNVLEFCRGANLISEPVNYGVYRNIRILYDGTIVERSY